MDETMNEIVQTAPFAPFEWMLSGRYLRARRREGFISVIAGFSFLGIMLGVATLIIVMAVMNGFRKELLDKILGLNGHLLVKDKGRDRPILRTIGSTQGAIMRIFLITGSSIGVMGTIAGFLLGVVVCLNVESIRQFLSWLTRTELFSPELYFLSRLPAELDAGETTAVVVMALTLSLLATLYPSWRAARLDPVEALRYE